MDWKCTGNCCKQRVSFWPKWMNASSSLLSSSSSREKKWRKKPSLLNKRVWPSLKELTTFCLSLQELTSPRLIKSHLPYRFLPTALHNGEAKVRLLYLLYIHLHLNLIVHLHLMMDQVGLGFWSGYPIGFYSCSFSHFHILLDSILRTSFSVCPWFSWLQQGRFSGNNPVLCVSFQVIYMARNPKDLVVSYYQFHRSLRTMSYRGTFQEFCRRFMNDKCKWSNLWI